MHFRANVRPATSRDVDTVKRLAIDNRMFEPDDIGDLDDMVRGYLDGRLVDHHWLVLDSHDDGVLGAAYYAPEPFADRVWNLYFIAVRPDRLGSGVGSVLLAAVEKTLRSRGEDVARVLLVETSGTDSYANARAFYSARRFHEEARIRDFYGPGDDKVVFWKSLTDR